MKQRPLGYFAATKYESNREQKKRYESSESIADQGDTM